MRRSARFIVLILSLVFLLTSAGGFGFNAKKFAHDLDHHGQLPLSSTHHAPSKFAAATHYGEANHETSAKAADLEHQLLHAAGTVQLFTVATVNFFWAPAGITLLPMLHSRPLAIALLETPFRPPRCAV
jgi:hypothetical protein